MNFITERDLSQRDDPPDAIPAAARTDHIALISNAKTTTGIEQHQQPESMPHNNNKGMRITHHSSSSSTTFY